MIRPMTAEDINHVQKIARTTWQATYGDLIPESIQTHFLESSYSDMMLMKRMEKTNLLIIQDNDNPIGFINFTATDADGDAELIAIYVSPAYQQKGYGKMLVQAMLESLTNTLQLFTYVDHRNINSRHFYEKEGFQYLQTLDEYFEGHPVKTAEYLFSFEPN